MVEVNDTKVLFLAIWLHETYEAQAREVGWKTQESCRVKFDELPEANKKVMLKIARDVAYNLEVNKEEGRVEGAKEELEKIIKEINNKRFYRIVFGNEEIFSENSLINYIEKRLLELEGEQK